MIRDTFRARVPLCHLPLLSHLYPLVAFCPLFWKIARRREKEGRRYKRVRGKMEEAFACGIWYGKVLYFKTFHWWNYKLKGNIEVSFCSFAKKTIPVYISGVHVERNSPYRIHNRRNETRSLVFCTIIRWISLHLDFGRVNILGLKNEISRIYIFK